MLRSIRCAVLWLFCLRHATVSGISTCIASDRLEEASRSLLQTRRSHSSPTFLLDVASFEEEASTSLEGIATISLLEHVVKETRSNASEDVSSLIHKSVSNRTRKTIAPKQNADPQPQLNPEDAGIASTANSLLHFSSASWILVCIAISLGLIWNVYHMVLHVTADSQEDETMFENFGFAATWALIGICVILFNKCLFMEDGSGFGFPRPVLLNWFHMFGTAAFTHLVRITRPDAMPAITSLTARTYFYTVVPIAFLQMVVLCLGNIAYLYISVSYIQMVKNTTSAFVFLFSISMGFEVLTYTKAIAVTLVISGMMLTTGGDQYFNLLGFILQMSSTVAESCRLCLTKALMSTRYSANLDPMSACCVSSSSVCIFLTIPMLIIDYPNVTFGEIWDLRLVLCANALLVVYLNLTSMRFMKKVGPTTYALTGILKDVALVAALLLMFGSGIANLKALGFAVSLVGLLLYNSYSSRKG